MNKTSNPNVYVGRSVSTPRNGFDLSNHDYFTKSIGLITPAFCMDVAPNDYVKIDVANFTRTMPVNTAAFTRIHERVDYYFVPYRLIWRWWTDFATGTPNTDSSYNPNSNTIPISVPYVLGSQIATLLNKVSTDSYYADIYGFPIKYILFRLLDMLGYPVTLGSNPSDYINATATMLTAKFATTHFNVFRLFAFMRIYHDYYRNSDYEVNSPISYNLDKYAGATQISDADFYELFHQLGFCYKNMSKDYFTGMKPSNLYAPTGDPTPTFPSFGGNTVSINGYSSKIESTTTVSAMAIRTALAKERLATLAMLAPKTYRDQMKALFNADIDNCDYCSCRYLGSYKSDIQIGEVIATAAGNSGAENDTSILGQVAGKGVGSGSGHIRFKSGGEHGIVMGMHYLYNDVDYNSGMVDLFNVKFSRSDYHNPTFDGLGMQPVTALEYDIDSTSAANINTVIGYHARYSEYKNRLSKAHGQFRSDGLLRQWCAPFKPNSGASPIFTPTCYKYNPSLCNTIFQLAYNGSEVTDQFECHYQHSVVAVRDMSVLGIPHI